MFINKLTISGAAHEPEVPSDPNYPQLTLEKTVVISPDMRGEARRVTVELRDDHLVELVYADDTRWLCAPDTLEELYPGLLTQQRDTDSFQLPVTVSRPGLSRGIVEQIALKVLNVFTRKAAAIGMAELAKDLEAKQLGDLRGLLHVSPTFQLQPFQAGDPVNTINPVLLFIHGTNSSSAGSFQELVGTDCWSYITKAKYSAILAFNHETLTKSPVQNAAELIDQLPAGVELHLITHSRGGLVGEVLARCSDADGASGGFTDDEITYLIKEDRASDVDFIRQMRESSRQKRFRVTKFIRVACPSGGTSILSNRLDHFFNISLNIIGLATGAAVNPIYIAMKNLLTAIIDQKNDPHVLPGLEAMKPDSPFITVLNNPELQETVIQRQIVAITGNCKTSVSLKALLILVGKLFFFQDNDLVVDTRSMYVGSQRKDKLQFFLDEGSDVDHFHYFVNKRTNIAIQYALQATGDNLSGGFTQYSRGAAPQTAESQMRQAALNLEGGQYASGEPSGKKNILLLVPGIMGSCLTKDSQLLWISYWRMLTGDLFRLDISEMGIQSLSVIETSYKELAVSLSEDYDVVTFAYDWRQAPSVIAGLLEARIRTLMALGQKIRVVAHSLGGVIVRDLMVFYGDTWKRLNSSPGFKLLFLGTPFRGSHRILNVLLGRDAIIRKLSQVDLLHSKKELLGLFSRYPGILGLLPLDTTMADDLALPATWVKLVQALGEADWPRPHGADLADFGAYRQAVLAGEHLLDFSNAIYIAGQDTDTPCGYRIDTNKGTSKLVFLSTGEGDQSVTWDTGIPAAIKEAGAVYYVNHTHGELCCSRDMYSGIAELLEKGSTNLFSKQRPTLRSDQQVFRRPDTNDFDLSEDGVKRTLLGLSLQKTSATSQLPLKVRVTHGDLRNASYPILAGHFRHDSILYGEKRINQLLEDQLEQRYRLGIYPGETGSSDILLTYSENDFKGAIIVGLGDQEKLTGYELLKTIELAASKYLLLVNGRQRLGTGFKGPIGLSSLIIGCGYGGLTVESSVQAVTQGIANANAKIGVLYGEQAKQVEEVEFIELYQDRVLACYYAIQQSGRDTGAAFRIIAMGDGITKCNGARQKVNVDQGEDWWGRITITQKQDEQGNIEGLNFSVSTGAAREETRTLYTAGGVVESLIESISAEQAWTPEKARAVFELLIPNDFKPQLKRHGNITWVLDKYAAQFPWELLQHKGEGVKPLCISAGMIRQLATGDSRLNIESVTKHKALVVGDPKLHDFLPQLKGAYQEANAVAKLLQDQQYVTTKLVNSEADEITIPLMSGEYKVIHLAGHGIFEPGKLSGMVLGKNNFLSTCQIASISDTPDLVFVNCCWLGKTSLVTEEYYRSRYKLAANIGTQLIENGVKAVVVAGWAVDDAVARVFATTFYEQMLAGAPFGEAVRIAREKAYELNSSVNTWGAYQCYGNPYYRLINKWRSGESRAYVIPEQAEVDLTNLSSDQSMGEFSTEEVLTRLNRICNEVDQYGLRTPIISEIEAGIYKELNQYEQAINKYKNLLDNDKGEFSFTVVEQYLNLRAKLLVQRQAAGELPVNLEPEFDKLINDLQALIQLSPTEEHYSILASTWKRRISLYTTPSAQFNLAIRNAADNYRLAYEKSKKIYGYTNWIALENLLVAARTQEWGRPQPGTVFVLPTVADILDTLKQFRETACKRPKSDKYWVSVAVPNLQYAEWMVSTVRDNGQSSETQQKEVVLGFLDLWKIQGTIDDKQVEIQHTELLLHALITLSSGYPMIASMQMILEELKTALT